MTWVYEKLYVDQSGDWERPVLLGYVGKVAVDLMRKGQADRFFFLRYFDSAFHVRFRVRLLPGVSAEFWLNRGRPEQIPFVLSRVQAEYVPDDYGGAAGRYLAESNFTISSAIALRVIETCEGGSTRALLAATCLVLELLRFEELGWRNQLFQYSASYWLWFGAQNTEQKIEQKSVGDYAAVLQRACVSNIEGRLNVMTEIGGDKLAGVLAEWAAEGASLRRAFERNVINMDKFTFFGQVIHLLNNRLGLKISDEILIAQAVLEL